jgi:hypothetical protein
MYVYWKIRRRQEWGYKLLSAVVMQHGTKDIDSGSSFKEGGKEGKADKVVAMTMCNQE